MKHIFLVGMLFWFGLGANLAFAGAGHYTSGVEGIRAASVPPAGGNFYWRMYNAFYTASSIRDNNGSKAPGDFNVNVYALANRFIYSSDIEILGGNLLFDVIIPTVYTDISYKGIGPSSFGENKFGLGDIFVEPLFIGWHGDRWDALAAIGAYVPTGDYDRNRPASPGLGFWTIMYTLGGTVYLDEEKTWSASVLGRFETHTEQDQTDITPGNHLHFEWGIGKNINKTFDIGVAGYCHWQVSDDSGPGASGDRERAYAIGPEIGFAIESIGVNVAVRSLWEFENKNKAQGNITSLNFAYAF
ncbi:MAG: transporter [Candidatus Adiutrix sp.]|nr:transporter [Candidatus Adiutrix sp.]